jgi:hypothetical protein
MNRAKRQMEALLQIPPGEVDDTRFEKLLDMLKTDFSYEGLYYWCVNDKFTSASKFESSGALKMLQVGNE